MECSTGVIGFGRNTQMKRANMGSVLQEDIDGAHELLREMAGMPDSAGWRELQSRIRGPRTIDVAEWRAATDHQYVHPSLQYRTHARARACTRAHE